MYECQVRRTILHLKMAGWLLLEAAQTSLSNLLLLAVSYDIIPLFSRIVCPSCFMRNEQKYACVEQNGKRKSKKKSDTIVFLEHELDC